MADITTSKIQLYVAEPAPIGLFGLAMGCLLLMMVDFGITSGQLMMIPWVFLLPASLQLIAGLFDFLRHNVFGGTAFIGYAAFWYGLSWVYYSEINYADNENIDYLLPSDPIIRQHTGVIQCGYLIFSISLTIISAGLNRVLFSVLLSIDFTFLVLIIHTFLPDSMPSSVVGFGLVLVFLTSIYGFFAILLLKVAGGAVLPIGAPLLKWSDYVRKIKRNKMYKPQNIQTDFTDDDDDELIEEGDDDELTEDVTINVGLDSLEQCKKKKNNTYSFQVKSKSSLQEAISKSVTDLRNYKFTQLTSKKNKTNNNEYYVPIKLSRRSTSEPDYDL